MEVNKFGGDDAESLTQGQFVEAYSGATNPDTTQIVVTSVGGEPVRAGFDYLFRVTATYLNGFSAEGAVTSIRACAVPSLSVGVVWSPALVSTSSTSMTIEWPVPPQNSLPVEGCHITGYALYLSGDAGASFTEIDSAQVRDHPNLHEHAVASSNFDEAGGSDVGSVFLLKVEAINVAGSLSSSTLAVVLADAPAAPTSGPSFDQSLSDQTRIHFLLSAVDATDSSATGGSEILSYSLEVDDGAGGNFVPLYGADSDSLSTQYLHQRSDMRGLVIRARHRAKNAVGWSEYSPITQTRAAERPSPPPSAPVPGLATDTTIGLVLTRSEDNGGSDITRHELWVDDGALGAFSKVASYDGSSLAFTVDQAVETALVTGLTYRFKSLAVNDVGSSDFTGATSVALASLPSKPAVPERVASLSTASRIVLQWVAPASSGSPGGDITGYRLLMDDGLGGDFTVIYDGDNAPSLVQYVIGGDSSIHAVVAGRGYRFRLAARAFNGLGELSDITTIWACAAPSGLEPPLLELNTGTTMTLTWLEPASNGACPITGYSLLVDDGVSGYPDTQVSGMATDLPTLRSSIITFAGSSLGTTFTFKLGATNRQGSTESALVSYLFAVAPDKPPSGPTIVSASSTSIRVQYD